MKRAFGRDRVPDRRDERYPIAFQVSDRRSRTWGLGPVTDQGSTPHCVGYAWAGWLAAEPVRQRPMDPDGIYRLAQYLDEWEGEAYDGTSVRGAAKVLRTTGHVSEYRWAFDIDTALSHVMEAGPVVLGVDWHDGMMETDRDGFVWPYGRVVGGHAVLWYGADLRSGYARVRNSWGPAWGLRGNCRITLDDLDGLIRRDGECCTAAEARPTGTD